MANWFIDETNCSQEIIDTNTNNSEENIIDFSIDSNTEGSENEHEIIDNVIKKKLPLFSISVKYTKNLSSATHVLLQVDIMTRHFCHIVLIENWTR